MYYHSWGRHGRPEAEAVALAAPRSAARSTRSARRRSTRARSATARAARTGCAPVRRPTAGREVVAPSTTTTTTTTTRMAPGPRDVTVAVDANGADLGPAEVAAGAALAAAQGRRASCSSGRPTDRAVARASRSSTPRCRSPRRRPGARRPGHVRRLDRAGRARRRRGDADALRQRRLDRRGPRRRPASTSSAPGASTGPRWPSRSRSRRTP